MGTDALTQEDTTVCKKNEGQPRLPLEHTDVNNTKGNTATTNKVPPAGVEPATYSLRVNRSNQLSYGGLSSPGPLALAHAQDVSGGTVRAAVGEGLQLPAHLHYQTVSVIVKRTQRQTHAPGVHSRKHALV